MTTQPSDELLDKIEEIATLKRGLGYLERLDSERFGLQVSSRGLPDGIVQISAAPPSSILVKLIFFVDSRGRRKVEKYRPGEWETRVDATLDITRALSRAATWTVPDEKADGYYADEAADWDDPKWREAQKALREALAEHKREIQTALGETDQALNMTIERVFFNFLADEWPVERLELLSHRRGDVVAVENLRDSYAAGYAVGKGWLSSEHLDNLLIDFANEIVRLIREMTDKASRRYAFVEALRKVAALGVAAARESVETSAEGVYESAGARRGPESSREKKQRLRAELTATSEEREPPPPLQGDTGAKASPDVPRWLGYAAFGLFIIGLVSFLLPWLVFSFWCYRRGRREGAALTEGVEPLLPYFPARLTGWLLASILLPIVDWFTAVHVPTMCYQQGLRVGASKGTASKSFTNVAELAVWTAAITVAVWIGVAGVAFAVLVSEDNDQPASVEQPTLQEEIAGWQWQPMTVGCPRKFHQGAPPGTEGWRAEFAEALKGSPIPSELRMYRTGAELQLKWSLEEKGASAESVARGVGAEPGFDWAFCLLGTAQPGNIMGNEPDIVTKVTGPDGVTRESVEPIIYSRPCVVYPIDFPGASSGTPGVYTAQFEVEGVNVGHASCTVVEP